jgi:flagellar secretion chaperone FliS
MSHNSPVHQYQQESARGASPVGQVVALYDTILRDLVRALAALQAGDIETRVAEFNHALLVIAHLQNALNHEAGGEAAKRLDEFYNVARKSIVDANFSVTPEAVEHLIEMFAGVRQAWNQIDHELRVSPPGAPPVPSNTPASDDASGAAIESEEVSSIQWSA